ncbi:hypothetical protein FHX42_001140 [Saccharopolyspora lacisalsi]|uniref:Uncharacterized protein n=1 Tax=Halosaccharopolyspora lacisalsi TaxID=1000566 RepID=A0A839DX73_9PSEU|nr:hypothetical protein [Halosaccharopolyspora lacisalsi]
MCFAVTSTVVLVESASIWDCLTQYFVGELWRKGEALAFDSELKLDMVTRAGKNGRSRSAEEPKSAPK